MNKKSSKKLYKSNAYTNLLSADDILNKIQEHYEMLPYPYRAPEDEEKGLREVTPGNLVEIQHYIYGGKRDFSKPFKVLSAGGGTGDSVICLAQRLQDANCPSEVVHLDLSVPSQQVAAARVKARGLKNVRFVQGSLLDCKKLGLDNFDYIDCCGVLHHLPDTKEGFEALNDVLNPDGGMGIMLYGTLGRTGVYYIQDMMKMLFDGSEKVIDKAKFTKRVLKQLPSTNWMKHNKNIYWETDNDNEIYDLFCHVKDRSFRVDEICEMLKEVRLKVIEFMSPFMYDPTLYVSDPALLGKIDKMSQEQKWLFSELISGNKNKHIFYVKKETNPTVPLTINDMHAIPHITATIRNVAKNTTPGESLNEVPCNIGNMQLKLNFPPLSSYILPAIDQKRTMKEIYSHIKKGVGSSLDQSELERDFKNLSDILIAMNQMILCEAPMTLKDHTFREK